MPDFTVLSGKAEDLSAFVSLTDDARNLIMEACHGRSAFSGIKPPESIYPSGAFFNLRRIGYAIPFLRNA